MVVGGLAKRFIFAGSGFNEPTLRYFEISHVPTDWSRHTTWSYIADDDFEYHKVHAVKESVY